MALPEAPAILGKDLNDHDRDAFQHGHDADTAVSIDSDAKEKVDGDAEKADVNTSTSETTDPDIVDWDGPNDPANPMNWSSGKKWSNIAVLSAITLIVPLGSSFFAPAIPEVLQEFDVHSEALATWVLSVYVLGFAVGPFFFAPASEMYGRLPVYHGCNVLYICFSIGAALAPNMSALIVFRLFQGTFGSAALTNGGGTISDMMPAEKRGSAMSIWAIGPLLGPIIAPIAGGFLSQAAGWRWIMWTLTIAIGVIGVLALLIMRESYAPVILERKTQRLRKETGNMNLKSKLDSGLTTKERFKRAIVRPSKLLFLSPICTIMSIYLAITYGVLYLLFATFTFVFEDTYHFSQSIVGLTFLGMGIGTFAGLFFLGMISDPLMKRLAAKHSNGELKPEYRLPPMIMTAPLLPIGLFIYGWTAQYAVHWIVPLIGTFLVGISLIAVFMCVTTYTVDAYTKYAASAMAANTLLRSIFGAVFPLFALQMYGTLGLGWGNSLIAFIGVAIIPVPILFYYYGERIRTNPRWQPNF